ncbi:MAG: peptide chain release factor N(5)-glutamine methyltransferase [Dehalococcoidia bacterium]|nr:peptide chain release factor N(5)-glutamine methyltransferase [Dehalococcoidia bacterium]
MTCAEWLRKYTTVFREVDIGEAGDEAMALLCHALRLNKAAMLSQLERTLTGSELTLLEGMTERRLRREPAAYITGEKEFYGLSLFVDPRVLIPRPETETLVEAAIEFQRSRALRNRRRMLAADVGTGCGAIAIALAANIPEAHLYAVDISPAALEVAVINVHCHGLGKRITLVQGNLLEQINQKMDLIVANLPYIRSVELAGLQPEIYLHEPILALDGGDRGTEIIETMLSQALNKMASDSALLLEIGAGQEERLGQIIRDILPGSDVALVKDLAGINRCMRITNVA